MKAVKKYQVSPSFLQALITYAAVDVKFIIAPLKVPYSLGAMRVWFVGVKFLSPYIHKKKIFSRGVDDYFVVSLFFVIMLLMLLLWWLYS